MRVLGDKIAVVVENASATTTAAGLFIAATADAAQFVVGKVTEVGPTVDVSVLTVGNKVHFNRFSVPKIKVGGIDYFILKQDEVLAVE